MMPVQNQLLVTDHKKLKKKKKAKQFKPEMWNNVEKYVKRKYKN